MIYKKNSYINIVSFLLYLLPLALLTGPFLPDLIVTCASISFVYYSLKFKEKKYFKNYFFYFFSIMWIVFMSSSFLSENILISLKSSLAYIRQIIFIFLVYFIIDKNKKFLKKFNFYLIILLTLVVFDSIIQKSFGFNLFGFKKNN